MRSNVRVTFDAEAQVAGLFVNRIRAGMLFVAVNLVASLFFLIGVATIYAATGTLNMADVAGRLPGLVQETQIYGQHLVHADAMLGRLLEGLEASGRPWALCFFGDHPPILRSIGNPAPDHRTDYLIVTSTDRPSGAPEEIDSAELGRRFRQHLMSFATAKAVLC